MSALAASAALLRSSIVSGPPRDPALVAAWERGTVTSLPVEQPRQMPLPFPVGPYSETARQIRVYDRAGSCGRKRTMGGDGKLPNTIRNWFTEGERAVLTVIAIEVKRQGVCELPVDKIAERAGVSVRTVQYALATARGGSTRRAKGAISRPALINVEYRRKTPTLNDTNVITIISREWLLWLDYRPSEAPASGCTEVHCVQSPNPSLSLKSRANDENRLNLHRFRRRKEGSGRGRPPARAAPS